MTDEQLDFDDDRELCANGACIGVVGPDGRCKLCGQPASGAASLAAPLAASVPIRGEAQDADELAGFDPGRQLCPDGTCIGVIGTDGKCRACGRLDEHEATT